MGVMNALLQNVVSHTCMSSSLENVIVIFSHVGLHPVRQGAGGRRGGGGDLPKRSL